MLDICILRQAAAALLNEAPMPVVRGMLRALLDGSEVSPLASADTPASARQSQESQRPEPKPAPVRTKPAPASAPKPKRTRPPPGPDSAWDERRRELRAAMLDRNVSYSDLATKFRVRPATLKHALHRRVPPGLAMKRRLDSWMKAKVPAPVVAAEPFRRPNGTAAGHANAGHSGSAAAAD